MERKINLRPIMIIAATLCLGQFFAYNGLKYGFSLSVIFVLVLILGCLIAPLFFKKGSKIKAMALLYICAITLIFGFFNVLVSVKNFENADIKTGNYTITGKVDSVYYDGDDYKCVILRNLTIKNKDIDTSYKLKLFIYDDISFRKGDILTFSGEIENFSSFYENKLSVDNIIKKIKYTATIDEYSYNLIGSNPTVFDSAYNFISDNAKSFDTEEYPIALALLTGDDTFMSDEVISAFRYGGVAHIFAVSGLHIGFLATALAFLLRKTKNIKIIIIPIILFAYSGICGFTSSSLRATIMISVSLIASWSGEKYDSLSALSLSAIIVLIFGPLQLFTPGFILSYSVVFCMLTLGKRITNSLHFLPENFARSIGAVISAQIGSIPASLYFFNMFSLIAPAVNLIIIPIISLLFVLIVFGIIIGGIFSIPNITLYVQNFIVGLLRKLFLFFDFDIFMTENISIGYYVIVYFLLIIILSKIINLKRSTRIITSIILSVVMILGCTATSYGAYNQTVVVATHSTGFNAVAIHKQDKTTVVISTRDYMFSFNNLNRFMNSYSIVDIDELIILDTATDIQTTVSALYSEYKISNVIYLSDYAEDLLNGYFNYAITFEKYYYGETFESVVGEFVFVEDGITFYKNNIKILIATANGDCAKYYGDVLVAPSANDGTESNFNTILTYYKSVLYPNCVTDGNLKYKIVNGALKRC